MAQPAPHPSPNPATSPPSPSLRHSTLTSPSPRSTPFTPRPPFVGVECVHRGLRLFPLPSATSDSSATRPRLSPSPTRSAVHRISISRFFTFVAALDGRARLAMRRRGDGKAERNRSVADCEFCARRRRGWERRRRLSPAASWTRPSRSTFALPPSTPFSRSPPPLLAFPSSPRIPVLLRSPLASPSPI
ncbi:hypothetical protein AAT19DRAFT_14154 [Rhodotorula toruloides]|uniref:Uncharacterized protein n=1 Tax=Rhodotorula toruloides TaxID=5286 RepID=A0A2T0AAV5_RHOTO|nr:hypothetical protein AAT19DRAFT_14154 [Rhodotorula toruloides]